MKSKRSWLEKISGDMIALGVPEDLSWAVPADAPAWVRNIERILADMIFPAGKLSQVDKLTAKALGHRLGQQCAFAVWMVDALCELACELERRGVKSDPKPKSGEASGDDLAEWYSSLRRLAKKALALSVDQTYQEMSDFLTGYSAGFARKPDSFNPAHHWDATLNVYIVMFVGCACVQKLTSVTELHLWLQALLGRKGGSQERVKKLCQRIQLQFRAPGRPRHLELMGTPQN